MEFLAAFILAFLISMIFAVRDKKGASWTELVIFFFILFLAGVAGQYWIMPFGPVLYGISWLPLIFIVLIVTFLFAAPARKRRKQAQEEPRDETASAVVVISIFTWLLLFLLLVSVLIGYSRRSSSNENISKPPVTIKFLNHHGIKSIA